MGCVPSIKPFSYSILYLKNLLSLSTTVTVQHVLVCFLQDPILDYKSNHKNTVCIHNPSYCVELVPI